MNSYIVLTPRRTTKCRFLIFYFERVGKQYDDYLGLHVLDNREKKRGKKILSIILCSIVQ